MTSSRWQRVNELFHEALEREPAHRADFLAAACGDVRELHTEVDSLLASHDEADGFIEKPAFEVAADLLGSDSLPADAEEDPLIGESLGPYRVIEAVGHGGMGVVYRAEDTRLGRDVAIKALASHLTRDERSRERLRREARAAAALGHPGIATVFALEEFGDQLYVVYELVEGRTLRDELIDGPLDREHVVSTALEVAEALCAAHRQGIVHRDLKPENIMRAADGKVKILDFGLAIFEASSSSAVTDSAGNRDVDSSPQRLTLPGMVLGTPSYMSPEQLRGRTVDARFDIFSFGVLLYELASGTHPFEGGDPASTIARILEVEPLSLADAGEADGSELAAILARCLPKDPEDRYADAADLVANLERIAPSTTAADERPSRLPRETSSSGGRLSAVSPSPRHNAFWWWRFHQLFVGVGYCAMLYPLWLAKEWTVGGGGAVWGATVFFLALVPVGVAANLRLHLVFASRYYPGQLDRHRNARPFHVDRAHDRTGGFSAAGLTRTFRPCLKTRVSQNRKFTSDSDNTVMTLATA